MSDFLNINDLRGRTCEPDKFSEYELKEFGGKAIKVKHPKPGDYLKMQSTLITLSEQGVKENVSPMVDIFILACTPDNQPLFKDIDECIEVCKALPYDAYRSLLRACRLASDIKDVPEDAVIDRAKKLEAPV